MSNTIIKYIVERGMFIGSLRKQAKISIFHLQEFSSKPEMSIAEGVCVGVCVHVRVCVHVCICVHVCVRALRRVMCNNESRLKICIWQSWHGTLALNCNKTYKVKFLRTLSRRKRRRPLEWGGVGLGVVHLPAWRAWSPRRGVCLKGSGGRSTYKSTCTGAGCL